MKRGRFFGFLVLFALGTMGSVSIANVYINVPNANLLLEHLVKHSDVLLTEVNLTRANQFTIQNQVVAGVRHHGGWANGILTNLLMEPGNTDRIPDYFIGKIVNDFRMQTILLYDLWWKFRQPTPQLQQQFRNTDIAYHNALASTYFYIEALRRSYLITAAPGNRYDKAVLANRLVKLERIAWELRELMRTIRYAALFQFPLRRYCVEATLYPYRVNVQVNGPQNFIPFPYYHENRFWSVEGLNPVAPVENFQNYNAEYWSNQWNQLDQGYIGRGPGPMTSPPQSTMPYQQQQQGPIGQRFPYQNQGGMNNGGMNDGRINQHPQVQPPYGQGQQGPIYNGPMQPQQQQIPQNNGNFQQQQGQVPNDSGDVVPLNDFNY